jgi:hypothetical protein
MSVDPRTLMGGSFPDRREGKTDEELEQVESNRKPSDAEDKENRGSTAESDSDSGTKSELRSIDQRR